MYRLWLIFSHHLKNKVFNLLLGIIVNFFWRPVRIKRLALVLP